MVIVTATAVAVGRAATAVAAAGDQKENDDEKPDHVVVIENIAETIHNILPSPSYGDFIKSEFRKKGFSLPLCYHFMTESSDCYNVRPIFSNYFLLIFAFTLAFLCALR